MINRLAVLFGAFFVLLFTGAIQAPVAAFAVQQVSRESVLPAEDQTLSIDEEALLVLEVRIDKKGTGQGLIAYQHEDDVLLPLGALCTILELAIMVDSDQGTAQGWIIDEERTFELNLPAQTISRNGNLMPLTPGTVAWDHDDIYVLTDVLESWLPLDLKFNLQRMNLVIIPREALPFQSRLKRDEQRALWLLTKGKGTMNYPIQLAPYRLWSWPLVDATMGFNGGRQTNSRRLALTSNFDLGGLSSNLFLSHMASNGNSHTNARFKAGRWNREGTLLGPAGATHYEFGDLYFSRVPLISASKQGLGAMISNQSLNHSREFNTTDVQGDALPGWEAELYINGSLYDFQIVGESGQFLFTGVPLIMGNNTFRTILRGPRGETREVVRNANLSPEMADVGQLKYKATIIKDGGGLLSDPLTRTTNYPSAWSQQLELAYALTSSHALVSNFSRMRLDDKTGTFGSMTSHNSLGRIYLETILAKSLRSGASMSVGARTRLAGQNLFALYNLNDEYVAEAIYAQSYLERETVLRSSGTLAHLADRPLSYTLGATNKLFQGRDVQQENKIKFSLATSLNGFHLSHNAQYIQREFLASKERSTRGTQLLRTQIGPISYGAEVTYQVDPMRFRSSSSTINWYRNARVQLSSRAMHYWHANLGTDHLSADLTVFLDQMSLGAKYSYFEGNGSAFGLTLGTSLTRDNRSSSWIAQNQRLANRAVASVRAFIDLNNNNTFDGSDEPLPGLGFRNLSVWRNIRTNEDGIALLPGLMVNTTQTIKLDISTVSDPYLVPSSMGVNVVSHPGSFTDVEFPLTYVGEIEGMVLDVGGEGDPVRYVGLEILDGEGNRVQSTVAEFDGYYYFSNLFPGDYKLAVIAFNLNANRFELPEPVPFTVPPMGGFIEGPDIILKRKEPLKVRRPIIASVQPEIIRGKEPEKETPKEAPIVAAAELSPGLPTAQKSPVEKATVPGSAVTAAASSDPQNPSLPDLVEVPGFDEELTLSLIFEILYRNSLWPDEPIQ
ncbi:MAG: hypothetical protein KOO60_08280 [Gemmatimonadales bacterium]|nr:hypothetical protein [Gemmatimonadales bacterium]